MSNVERKTTLVTRMNTVRCKIGQQDLILETGKLAKLANAALTVQMGDTVILVAINASNNPSPLDYFPLMVEYRERAYAAGRVPGGFFKREGRPTEKETLTARLVDRPIRPLFPDGYRNDVQVQITVLSADQDNDPDIMSVVGASAALCISSVPFEGPIGAVRVGRVGGQFVANPTYEQLNQSDLDLVVVGRPGEIVMLEAGAKEVSEDAIRQAIDFAQEPIREMIVMQQELVKLAGKPKTAFAVTPVDPALRQALEKYREPLIQAHYDSDKLKRIEKSSQVKAEAMKAVVAAFPGQEKVIAGVMDLMESEGVRRRILEKGERPDGRGLKDLRPITCEVGVLPRTHGSAIFSRGQTQSLGVVTLGTKDDRQVVEDLVGESKKHYMLHYNFPPYSVGEVKPIRAPSRRDIGHGALAERALLPMIPSQEQFPYVVRVVSEILESNGSSSMASVCSASLSLMDAGVPIKAAVGGISIGLVLENGKHQLLTDIQGLEDHHGDMDFKIAGTTQGITAIQLDTKLKGIPLAVINEAILQSRDARMFILETMAKAIGAPRAEISPYAPRIETIRINPEKIKDVIGPGGKVIRRITEELGVSMDVENDGQIHIASVSREMVAKAIAMIREITAEAEIGKIYLGKVRKIMDFGAFVEIFPGTDGLVHISQLADTRVAKVEDVLREGDECFVKVIGIEGGKVKLSRKEALQELKTKTPATAS